MSLSQILAIKMYDSFEFSLNIISWEAVSAISALLIAAFGFAISRSLRRQEIQSQRYALLGEYRNEIIAFSKEFFEIVAEALAIPDSSADPTASAEKLDQLSMSLSGLIDTGRFLFPNDIEGENAFGFQKGPAFAGRRRAPLDAILAAHFALEAMKHGDEEAQSYLDGALRELRKTKQPLTKPIRDSDPVYLLIQSRRCYLNSVVPDTFPREWLTMFSTLLGPIEHSQIK